MTENSTPRDTVENAPFQTAYTRSITSTLHILFASIWTAFILLKWTTMTDRYAQLGPANMLS